MSKDNGSKVALPDWLEAVLPEPQKAHRLSTRKDGDSLELILTAPDGTARNFATVREVDKVRTSEDLDLEIQEDVYEHFDPKGHRFLRYEIEEDSRGSVGVLIATNDRKRRRSLESSYAEFLETEKLYSWQPDNFQKSWSFIDSHPAFWTNTNLEAHPWHWETQGYCSKIRQFVSGDAIYLDAGGHVEEATHPGSSPFSEHYADWRLEVGAPTFEQAIIELAFRVSRAFDSQGNSLEESDFPYDPPSWMVGLRESLKR